MKTLKDYTQALHDAIEKSELSQLIFSGEITKKQWDLYVFQKYKLYTALEERLALPDTLQSSRKLEDDCAGLARSLCVATATYLSYLNTVTDEDLWGHVYVHYMGELYGGQVLKKRITHENKTHMDFEDRKKNIEFVRSKIDGKHEELSTEAKAAFKLMMDIQDEIFTCTTRNS